MQVQPNSNRVLQKAVLAGANGLFSGKLEVVAIPVDPVGLTFTANIKAWKSPTESYTYSASDDKGKIKTFTSVDAIITWLRAAYTDITSLDVVISDMDTITKTFVPPTDALKDATAKKSSLTKTLATNEENLTEANLNVTRAATAGWNAPTAHPALLANYAELVAKRDALVQAKTYYTARIAFYQNIITPA